MSGPEHPAPGGPKRLNLKIVDPGGSQPGAGTALAAPGQGRDPVCGMTVPLDAPLRSTFQGQTFVFCNPRCKEKFDREPQSYLAGTAAESNDQEHQVAPPAASAAGPGPGVAKWTCPMHPEIVRDGPGSCPKCGMALEPMTVTADEGENPELTDMRRRLWVGIGLSAPLVLVAMGHLLPFHWVHAFGASRARPLVELVLASPVVLGGVAVLPARVGVGATPQPEHVHADRARRRG